MLPKSIRGNGSLGNTATFAIALILIAVAVYFVAQELLVWIGYAILFLLAIYGVKALGARKLGELFIRR